MARSKPKPSRKKKRSVKGPPRLNLTPKQLKQYEDVADFMKLARDRFDDAQESENDQRERELEDLAFAAGDQWPEDIRKARQGMQANAGLPAVPARPCLTINGTLEPCNQIIADAQDSELGFELVPADDFGELVGPIDDTEIKLREGLVRRIQRESEALDARVWGLDRGSKCGRGYWGVMTRYAEGKTNDQEIYVEKFYNQACVTIDPSHESITGSDADWGFVGRDIPWDEYEAEYGDVDGKRNPVCDSSDEEFRSLGDDYPSWFTKDGENRICRVVNYYWTERTSRELATLADGSVEWVDELPEGVKPESVRTVIEKQIKWTKIDGCQKLDETDWPSPYIPIIKYVGRELQPYDEQKRCEGIVRPAIDPGRAKNYMVSKWVEMVGLAPIPPLMMAGGQDEGFEPEYAAMNTRTLGILHYNQTDFTGRPAPPPFKTPAELQIAPVAQSIAMFDQAIQSATESHDTTHGKADPALRSGRAIEAVAANDRHGSSNYMAHWARSVEHEGRIINSLLYAIYGRPGRITRLVDGNGNQETVMLHQPFTMQGQGKLQRPVHAPDDPNAQKYTLTPDAKFNVVVKVTKNYDTRKQEEAAILGQIISSEPQAMMAQYGDLFFKNQDGPGHDEMAERAKVMLAPPIQQMLAAKAQGQDIPPQVHAQLQQMQQKIQEQEQIIQKAQQLIETDQVKHEAMLQKTKMEGENAIELAHINNAAKIEAARISAAKQAPDEGAEAQEELLATGIQHAQENFTADAEHQREIEKMGVQHQLDTAAAAQEHQQQMQQGDQQAANQAALAEQGQAHTLAQGQQAADLAPPSPNGSGA